MPDLCQTWFKKASEQGIVEASYKLGQCFEDGWGCAKNLTEAVRLYNIATHGVFHTQCRPGSQKGHIIRVLQTDCTMG